MHSNGANLNSLKTLLMPLRSWYQPAGAELVKSSGGFKHDPKWVWKHTNSTNQNKISPTNNRSFGYFQALQLWKAISLTSWCHPPQSFLPLITRCSYFASCYVQYSFLSRLLLMYSHPLLLFLVALLILPALLVLLLFVLLWPSCCSHPFGLPFVLCTVQVLFWFSFHVFLCFATFVRQSTSNAINIDIWYRSYVTARILYDLI